MDNHPQSIEFSLIQESVLASFRRELETSMLVANQSRQSGMAVMDIAEWKSGRVNAKVDVRREDNRLEYRFSHGLCFGIFDACEMLVLDPRFCSDLTLDDSERLEITGQTNGIRRRFSDYTSLASPLEKGFPLTEMLLDGPRRVIGDILYSLAVKFVSLHEQGHVYQGHLNLRRNRGAEFRWMEMSTPSDTTSGIGGDIPARDRRALELQADGFASKVLISLNADQGIERLFPDNEILATPVDWIFFSVLAATVVFSILDLAEQGRTNPEPETRLHPQASMRLLGVFAELRQTLFDQVPDEQQRNVFMQRLLSECDVVFDILGVQTLDVAAFNAYFSRPGMAPANEMADELWNHVLRLHELDAELETNIREAKSMFGL